MPLSAVPACTRATDTISSSRFEATSAEELEARSFALRTLPKPNGAHTYKLREKRADVGPSLLTRHDTRKAGCLQVSHVVDHAGTEIGIIEPGIEYHCFSLVHSGALSLSVPGGTIDVVGTETQGTIHRGEVGLHALTLDGTRRTNLWVATARLEAALMADLNEPLRVPLAFEPILDWEVPACAAIRRLINHAAADLAQADGLAASRLALTAFSDLIAHTAVQRLAHNYSGHVSRASDVAVPKHVKRAEAFILAHALEPLTMEQIASAAGCSVRALQFGYRQFRNSTPYSALVNARLDGARHDLAVSGEPVGAVARKWGFSNPGRFAAKYRRRFGEAPAPLRRENVDACPARALP